LGACLYQNANIDIPGTSAGTVASDMNWTQLLAENPFLMLSIVSGSAAVAVLVYAIINSRQRDRLHPNLAKWNGSDNEPRNRKRRQTVFDRITLLNRNLAQCPRCFRVDFANVRFCSGCGMTMMPRSELLGTNQYDIETRHVVQDRSTRFFGISVRPDARTKIGVIIGLQDDESAAKLDELQQS